MAGFVNRVAQLASLEQWWNGPGVVAAVAGRRRVGKTWLAHEFARGRPAVVHRGAGRGDQGELHHLAVTLADQGLDSGESPGPGPFGTWFEAFDHLTARARDVGPLLLVLDNASDLLTSELVDALATQAGKVARGGGGSGSALVKVLLCTSSVRQVEALRQSGGPLAEALDDVVLLELFTPTEAAEMLPDLAPADRARVYGIVGGSPLYLSWWDCSATYEENLAELVCRPAARLLVEGDLLLDADLEDVGFHDRVLHGLAEGYTSYNGLRRWAGTEPARPLDRLIELRFIERVMPVGESRQARRRRYRIVDPFVRFYLAVACRYRVEIERGPADDLPKRLAAEVETLMAEVWLQAFRGHLAGLAADGALPVGGTVTSVGPWWDNTGKAEIDALGLGPAGAPVLAGTATWQPTMAGAEAISLLRGRVERGLGAYPDQMRFAACARDEVVGAPFDALVFTAADLFGD